MSKMTIEKIKQNAADFIVKQIDNMMCTLVVIAALWLIGYGISWIYLIFTLFMKAIAVKPF